MTEAARVHRGTIYLAATIGAVTAGLLPEYWWAVAAFYGALLLWHLVRFVFAKPEPRRRCAPGTTFTVADATGFPQGRFQVQIDDETYEVERRDA